MCDNYSSTSWEKYICKQYICVLIIQYYLYNYVKPLCETIQ